MVVRLHGCWQLVRLVVSQTWRLGRLRRDPVLGLRTVDDGERGSRPSHNPKAQENVQRSVNVHGGERQSLVPWASPW